MATRRYCRHCQQGTAERKGGDGCLHGLGSIFILFGAGLGYLGGGVQGVLAGMAVIGVPLVVVIAWPLNWLFNSGGTGECEKCGTRYD